jgi:hypothetical protein
MQTDLESLRAEMQLDRRRIEDRVTKTESWQSMHDAVCAFRWKVLQRIAVLGFAWLTLLIIGIRTPWGEAMLRLLG